MDLKIMLLAFFATTFIILGVITAIEGKLMTKVEMISYTLLCCGGVGFLCLVNAMFS